MNRIPEYGEVQKRIVSWLSDYLNDSGMNCWVIGVSGGIDSAVASTLAARTGKPVYAIGMPINQDSNQEQLSDVHLKWLEMNYKNVTTLKFDLTDTFGLVVGTGNKVEDYGVGFYTKYGDGGVDIAPIADLYKTEVWELGRYLGVDPRIVEAKPTDGLWDDGRTDEDQLGASYADLETAMEFGYGPGLEVLQRFNKMNQHKMQPIPTFTL
jgi:NAD+ synthase